LGREIIPEASQDFWFDNLSTKLDLDLEIEAKGYKKMSKTIRTQNDVNVGNLFLERK